MEQTTPLPAWIEGTTLDDIGNGQTTPLEDPADATVDECIDEMNNEMAKDIAYHLDALEKKRPGEADKFMKRLANTLVLTLLCADRDDRLTAPPITMLVV